MDKNCLNCMRVVPIYDGVNRVGQRCLLDEGLKVNGRMVCEEWKSDDLGGKTAEHKKAFAMGVGGVKTVKKR